MLMTKDVLVKACTDNGGYRQPRLNDQLFLQCRGFCEIANLDEYTELKALWLEQNALQHIEGLDNLKTLASLFIQNNLIRSLSGLKTLSNLRTLNVSHNYLTKITGLSGCPLLETVQFSHNRLQRLEDMEELLQLEHLSCIDASYNRIDDKPDGASDTYIVDFFARCPALTVLYLHGQELPRKFKHYRKTMVSNLRQLTYLDERPIFPQERRTAQAWSDGGVDAEKKEMAKIREEREEDLTACLRNQERMKSANKALKEQREREYAARKKAEEEWRAKLNVEHTGKRTELDHLEYEQRAILEAEEETVVDRLRILAREDAEAAIQQQEARLKIEAAERERAELERQAEQELAERDARLAAERDKERARQKEKFNEMQYWVKKFAEEDAEDEERSHRALEEMLEALQAPIAHAMPSEGPSTAGSAGEIGSATNSMVDPDRSSNASQPQGKKARRTARWMASAARFERFFRLENQQDRLKRQLDEQD